MICRYCGNVIDADAAVCPYCGSSVAADAAYDDPNTAYSSPADAYDTSSGAYDTDPGAYQSDDAYEDDAQDYAQDYAPPAKKKAGFKLPNIPVSTVISIASAIFSFICLLTVSSIKSNISDSTKTVMNGVNQLQTNITAIEDRLSGLDSTVASVQQDAYNQLASQTINITKDLLSLTGPVTLNKTAIMFTVKAKGSLSVNTSFNWQKYNETTGDWTNIVFTGQGTSNEEYGLRLENKAPVDGEYESILWASGITKAAEGTYRCVIKDTNGITKTSSQATVSVTDTAAT